MRKLLFSISLLGFISCQPSQPSSSEASQSCDIPSGQYKVQSASFLRSSSTYELFVMGAPACVSQPMELKDLQLAQLNADEGVKEAKLEMRGDGSILYLSKDFSINLVNQVSSAEGQTVREQSAWTPFIAGAAGAAVGAVAGQMISRSLFNKPRYYQPPVPQPGQSRVSGVGGYGSSPLEAEKSLQKNYGLKSGFNKSSSMTDKNLKPGPRKPSFKSQRPAPRRRIFSRRPARRRPIRMRRRR